MTSTRKFNKNLITQTLIDEFSRAFIRSFGYLVNDGHERNLLDTRIDKRSEICGGLKGPIWT